MPLDQVAADRRQPVQRPHRGDVARRRARRGAKSSRNCGQVSSPGPRKIVSACAAASSGSEVTCSPPMRDVHAARPVVRRRSRRTRRAEVMYAWMTTRSGRSSSRRSRSTCSSSIAHLVVRVAGSRPASPGPSGGNSEYLIGRKQRARRLGQRRQDHRHAHGRRPYGPDVHEPWHLLCASGEGRAAASGDEQRLHRRRDPPAIGPAGSGCVGPLHDLPHLPRAGCSPRSAAVSSTAARAIAASSSSDSWVGR